MKPETAEFLAYAEQLLGDAETMLASALPDHVARTAYLACFHAARAYAFERTERVAKTHRGVQTEFLRLSREDTHVAPELRVFLSQAYEYKSQADYDTTPGNSLNAEEAREVLATARLFVAAMAPR